MAALTRCWAVSSRTSKTIGTLESMGTGTAWVTLLGNVSSIKCWNKVNEMVVMILVGGDKSLVNIKRLTSTVDMV